MSRKIFGRYIVADPEICHGKPTFNGTRIMVSQVLEQVAVGMSWDMIVDEWRGDISRDSIAEAVRIANKAFADHSGEYTMELISA